MWTYLTLASAFLLGCYDVAKKKALSRNSVMWVLFMVSAFSCVLLIPAFKGGAPRDFLLLAPKAVMVASSWICGLAAMKRLPMTTASTLKSSRPVFVVLCSVLLLGERLNPWQWVGVVLVLGAIWMLSRSSRSEGIYFSKNSGVIWMGFSILTGVASALYDKWIMGWMDPIFVLCWSNLFVGILMGIVLIFAVRRAPTEHKKFHWDWMVPLSALLIIGADALYFTALGCEGAMLAVISLMRRSCVIVSFALGAILFRERNIRSKALVLAVMLAGLAVLVVCS